MIFINIDAVLNSLSLFICIEFFHLIFYLETSILVVLIKMLRAIDHLSRIQYVCIVLFSLVKKYKLAVNLMISKGQNFLLLTSIQVTIIPNKFFIFLECFSWCFNHSHLYRLLSYCLLIIV